ncbi:MAG: UDP-N-acetylmuramoyl-L-alanyl-D-glutamate--2,6-diaminopimelate ligase [Eubacteriales bacterium]
MLLSEFSGIFGREIPRALRVGGLCQDSRRAGAEDIFFCVRGLRSNGHLYAVEAYQRGCRVFVCEEPLSLPEDAVVLQVPAVRETMAQAAHLFYGHPSHRLTLIGVTGTKGKTTTAQMIARLLHAAGVPSGYIGTSGAWFGEWHRDTAHTTPEAIELNRYLAHMAAAGAQVAVLEVSSQAIMTHRIFGLRIPYAVWTNLSPDHIGPGEHPDDAHYKRTKARLFAEYGCTCAIYNRDDREVLTLLAAAPVPRTLSCSVGGQADWVASGLRPTRRAAGLGMEFTARNGAAAYPVSLPLPGEMNVSNALLALACAQAVLGGTESRPLPVGALAEVAIPGRFEVVPLFSDRLFLLDFAHNGYSVSAALSALRAYRPARLVCVVGAVGERCFERRADIGRALGEADVVILTSDNPGHENPLAILGDIYAHIRHPQRVTIIPDRAEALRYAVQVSLPGDMVLVAGKGQEKYQLIGSEKLYFSEKEILQNAFQSAPLPLR